MTAYTSGASWSFPDDLPGGWIKVEDEDNIDTDTTPTPPDPHTTNPANPDPKPTTTPPPHTEEQSRQRTHYPPRQCRICLEVVQPSFHTPEPLSTSLPAAFHPTPHVSYESPSGDGGRLLRPCKCKGSQKYVHEECLRAWRLQDPLQKRNYWQCPTCQYKYRLRRLMWGSWIASSAAQIALTILIFVLATFIFGFVADPIINLYLDPVSTVFSGGAGLTDNVFADIYDDDEPVTWTEHFVKGLASLGLLGFAKFLLTLSPWHWLNMRGGGGVYIGGGSRGNTGRDRLSQLSWIAILVGIATFLVAVWKGVRAWSRRMLEKAGERVMDVPGSVDDDEDEDEG